jgi:hypothetical protein
MPHAIVPDLTFRPTGTDEFDETPQHSRDPLVPAEYEGPTRVTSIGFSDPRTQPGELLWPDRFGPIEIANLKISLGSYGTAGQLQQRPSPAGAVFSSGTGGDSFSPRHELTSRHRADAGWNSDFHCRDRGTPTR